MFDLRTGEQMAKESTTRLLQKVSPRLIATNPVNGRVTIQVPTEFAMWISQLLNTIGKRSDYFATCVTCEHWDGHCKLYNVMPPPEIIANGCDSYEDKDYVPF